MTSPFLRFAAALVLAAGFLTACRGGPRVDPILQLSTQEALARGMELMEQKKYLRAQRYLEHAFEASPNSREGRDALLLSADALYLAGTTDSYIRCEAKYRDFINRFPTSDRADYAQLQVANCLAERMEKPDRDQDVTRKALAAYDELVRLYPTSPYIEQAQTRVAAVQENLAEAELLVGAFYVRYGLCTAAIERLAGLDERFPTYSRLDRVFLFLGRAYAMCGLEEDADQVFASLRQRYPESEYVSEIEGARKKAVKRYLKNRGKRRGPAPVETAEEGSSESEAGEEDAENEEEGAEDDAESGEGETGDGDDGDARVGSERGRLAS